MNLRENWNVLVLIGLSFAMVLMIVFAYISQNNKEIEKLVNQNEELITQVEGLSMETILLTLELEIMSQCRDVYIIY